ncbi:glycosyltransferase [Xanthomonas sp. CFBP 8703]|uniref:Glycosyltransferase n=1 Tax=Xanthomonas bonasiae TaxID=2810351 RepID=A0ABS3B387_9XANT|nr:glycosyltransferase [Xanthomonas bonasiae]MBN6102524.1 glycosyltransferase [Xanthomonas bonasiae]
MPSSSPAALQAAPTVSVVICTLNEHEAIGPVLRELAAHLQHIDYEAIVVDDSDDERTAQAVTAYAAGNPAVRLVRRRGGRGLASAAIAGWDSARGRCLAIMDGDGQHDPALIARMLRRMRDSEAEVVVASRYLEAGGSGLCRHRHALSRVGVRLSQALLGLGVADPMSGCFLMRRSWYRQVRPQLSGVGFKILVDVLASARRRPYTVQVPTQLRRRRGGASKLDARVVADLAALLLEKRTRGWLPARMSLFFAVGLSGMGVHLLLLGTLLMLGTAFWLAQLLAICTAMGWNFQCNNLLTFRDRRLSGMRLLHGMVMFYAACLGGAILSELIGSGLHALRLPWWLAGAAGALAAGGWNYHAAKRSAWRPEDAAAGVAPSRDTVAASPLAMKE